MTKKKVAKKPKTVPKAKEIPWTSSPYAKQIAASNYRICFEDPKLKIDYPFDFDQVNEYMECLHCIYSYLDAHNIKSWHHFEPYVELTFIAELGSIKLDGDALLKGVMDIIKLWEYKVIETKTPANGLFADWYCNTEEDLKFGIQSMYLTRQLAMEFMLYAAKSAGYLECKDNKGIDRMLMRRFHVLCNQIGFSYTDEARILNLRSTFAGIAATGVEQARAVKIYEEITKVKY